jgi:tetratricopeptide (TPR) repeat protein
MNNAGTFRRWPYRSALVLMMTVFALSSCSSPEQKKSKFLAAGKQLLAKKDYPRSILQFKNAIQLFPKDAEAHYQLAQAYLAAGGIQQAASELYKATELDPKHAKAQLTLAEVMAGSSNKELVTEAYKRAAAVAGASPKDADALTTLAFTELRLGQKEDAERDTLKALEQAPANLKSSMLLVALKLAQRDLPGAEQVLKQATESAPKSIEPLLVLGRFYRSIGRLPEAEAQFERAVQIDPKSGPALVDLAALQLASGRKQQAEETYKKASVLPDRQYRSLHALFLMTDNRSDAAIAEMKELVRKDPSDRDVRNYLIRAYLTTNKTQEANNLLASVLAKNPKDVDALMQRAALHLGAGQYEDAQKDLAPVLSIRPDLAQAHYLMARVHQARGATTGYRKELEEAVRRDPHQLRSRLELVSALMAGNAPQAALELIDQTPPDQRRSLAVMVQRTGALMANGRWADAEKDIESGLKTSRDPELLVQDALVKLQRKDSVGARKSLEEALTKNPENSRALEVLVSTYVSQGQLAAAIGKIQEYAVQRPQSSILQQSLGSLYLANRQMDRARTAFLAAQAADPKNIGIELHLAQIDVLENKLDDARKRLAPLLARDRNQGALMLMAEVAQRSGDTNAAIEDYRKILDKDTKNVKALNDLAYLLSGGTKLDEALSYAQQAKELAPDDMSIEDTLGWVYYCKGFYPVAAKHLETVNSKAPSARRKYHLAMAYLKMGDRQRGAQVMEQALKLDANLPEAQMAQQVLSESVGSPSQRTFR